MTASERLRITLCTITSLVATVLSAVPSDLLDDRVPSRIKRPLAVAVGALALFVGCSWGQGFYEFTLDARHGPEGLYLTMETLSAVIGFLVGYLATLLVTLGTLKLILVMSSVWRRKWNECAAKAGVTLSENS